VPSVTKRRDRREYRAARPRLLRRRHRPASSSGRSRASCSFLPRRGNALSVSPVNARPPVLRSSSQLATQSSCSTRRRHRARRPPGSPGPSSTTQRKQPRSEEVETGRPIEPAAGGRVRGAARLLTVSAPGVDEQATSAFTSPALPGCDAQCYPDSIAALATVKPASSWNVDALHVCEQPAPATGRLGAAGAASSAPRMRAGGNAAGRCARIAAGLIVKRNRRRGSGGGEAATMSSESRARS